MGASALSAAACLSLRSALDFLLAAYVLAMAELVVLALALSPGAMLTRAGLLIASGITFAIVQLLWRLRGRPRPPSPISALRTLLDVLRDPVVAVPAAAVSAGLLYLGTLAMATPPNDYDALWYHLPRAATWTQEHAVGYVAHANDARLDVFPPAAEIASAWTMALGGHERYAWLVQLAAFAAIVLAVAGIARRLGLEPRAAALGAVLFATLPVVLLQAATALNDVVLASFVVVAAHFLLSNARAGLALGSASLALAVATKPTALLSLALLVVAVAAVAPRRHWPRAAAAAALGIVAGGFWYAHNLVEKGSLLPRFVPDDGGPGAAADNGGSLMRIPAGFVRLAVDFVDPAGAVGRDRYLYLVAAGLVLVPALAAGRRGARRTAAGLGALSAVVVLLPAAFPWAHEHLLAAYRSALQHLDELRLARLGDTRDALSPSPFVSWYGPLAPLALAAGVALAVGEARRRRLHRGVVALALTPVLYAAIIAAVLGYSDFHGRYLMPAVALSAVSWSLLARVRPLAWAAAAIGVTTVALTAVHYLEKPAGIALLGGKAPRSVWSVSRLDVLGAAKAPGGAGPIRLLERLARAGDTVALRIRQDDVSFPAWGAELDRRVVFVDAAGRGLGDDADWLVVAPGLGLPGCVSAWRSLPTGEPGWRLYRRVGRCPSDSASS